MSFITNLLSRLTKIWSGEPKSEVLVETNPLGSAIPNPNQSSYEEQYRQPQNQYDIYQLADQADLLPFFKAALKKFSYGAAAGFIGVEVVRASDIQRSQEIVNALIKRVGFKHQLGEIFYRTAKYGNCYLEHKLKQLPNNVYQIEKLLYRPPYGMLRNSNDNDEFEDPNKAFQQQDIDLGVYKSPKPFAIFEQWRINHLRWACVLGERYGKPLGYSALCSGAVRRAIKSLEDLYQAREFGVPVDVHRLNRISDNPITSQQRETYIDAIAKARQKLRNRQPLRDLVVDADVTRLTGDQNIDKIKDVQLHLASALSEIGVSLQMLTVDEFANVGVLVERFRQLYADEADFAEALCSQLESSLLLELAFNGIDPDSVEFAWAFRRQYLFQDLLLLNSASRDDRASKTISEKTRIRIASELYGSNPDTEKQAIEAEGSAKPPIKPADRITPVQTGLPDPVNQTEDPIENAEDLIN